MKIIARGWEFEFTEKPTQWVAYKCRNCGYIETYPSNRCDGYRCPSCDGGPYVRIGYLHKIKELKK